MKLNIVSPKIDYLTDHTERMKFVRQLLPPVLNGNLLDIGCWEGNLRKLLPAEVNYYGVDWYTPTEKFANYIKLDLNDTNLPFNDNFFDYIIFTEVIEHLVNPENFLLEVKRVLKTQGMLVVSVANNGSLGERIKYLLYGPKVWISYGHFYAYTPDVARELIAKYFRIVGEKGYAPVISGLLPGKFKEIPVIKKLLQFFGENFPAYFAGNYFFVVR